MTHRHCPWLRRALLTLLAASSALVWAAPEGRDHDRRDGGPPGQERRSGPPGLERRDGPPGQERRDGPRPGPRPGAPGQWWDGAYGHNRNYPPPGHVIHTPPPRANVVLWGGVSYRFWDGIWYTPGARGYVVVRPPFGIVVHDVPVFRTLVTIAGISYLYANGVYYRERVEGGYEVVPPPTAMPDAPAPDKVFVYPRQGQTPQQQASDEYECHRWAVAQTGFDPTAAAVGQTTVVDPRRPDYQRARGACLEGRGYTVR